MGVFLLKKIFFLLFVSLLITSVGCSEKKPVDGNKETVEPNQNSEINENNEPKDNTDEQSDTSDEVKVESPTVDPSTSLEFIEVDKKPTEEMIKIIEDNVRFSEEENLEEYLKTMVQSAQESEATIKAINELFANFDIEYEILEMRVIAEKKDAVQVRVTLKSTATFVVEGMQFRNNIMTAIRTLEKENGEYKISKDTLENVEYLDEK